MSRRTRSGVLACVGVAALVAVAGASAHARMSPAISLSNKLQLYSLAIPTEKANAFTTKIVLTLPKGFSIDSFVPSPGWKRVERSTGSGENSVVTQVTWTGGHVPTEEDSLFQFLAQPSTPGNYTFDVQQTYSDGAIVNWAGPESSAAPAPTIDVVSSLGGGTSTLTIVALILGALGLLVGSIALFSRGGRALT
jgi:periplasmic copper chaperone A